MSRTLRRFRGSRFWLLSLGMAGLGVWLPPRASADTMNIEKKLTWEFESTPEKIGDMTGYYYLKTQASAKCSHGGDGLKQDPVAPQIKSFKVKDGVLDSAHAQSVAPHDSKAHAWADVRADSPVQDPAKPNKYTVSGKITADGWTEVKSGADVNHNPDVADGSYAADVTLKIDGVRVAKADLTGKHNGVKMDLKGQNKGELHVNSAGSKVSDPITLTLFEFGEDDVITNVWEQQLFSLDIESSAGSDQAINWTYDTTVGVVLEMPLTPDGGTSGSLSISGSATSSWLTDVYGTFGATLENGVFTATGAWADLPWDLTYDGSSVVRAALASSYLPSTLDYAIPDEILRDGYTYQQSLSMGESVSGFAHDESMVPLPSAATTIPALLGLYAVTRRIRLSRASQ